MVFKFVEWRLKKSNSIPRRFYEFFIRTSVFFTDEALTVMDETCTILEWALVADDNGDNTKLKSTFAFGTKGSPSIAEADD